MIGVLLALVCGQGLVGPVPGVQLQDEGVSQGQIVKMNFTGATVTCSKSGAVGTCNITAGGGAGNFGTTTVTFGNGGMSTYDSALKVVTGQTWVGVSSIVLAQPQCDGVGNTKEVCRVLGITCGVSDLVAGTGFTVVCVSPYQAHGNFTVGFSGQ